MTAFSFSSVSSQSSSGASTPASVGSPRSLVESVAVSIDDNTDVVDSGDDNDAAAAATGSDGGEYDSFDTTSSPFTQGDLLNRRKAQAAKGKTPFAGEAK